MNKGSAARFAFAAALFGEFSEALFWLQLPHALKHLMRRLLKSSQSVSSSEADESEDTCNTRSSVLSNRNSVPETGKSDTLVSYRNNKEEKKHAVYFLVKFEDFSLASAPYSYALLLVHEQILSYIHSILSHIHH